MLLRMGAIGRPEEAGKTEAAHWLSAQVSATCLLSGRATPSRRTHPWPALPHSAAGAGITSCPWNRCQGRPQI